MTQRVQVILVDDVDGGEAAETVTFALDGVRDEIDVSEANAAMLRDEFAPWLERARRVGGRRQAGSRASRTTSPGRSEELAKMRQWGRENGYQVSDRGRVSQQVQNAYAAAD